MIDQFLILDHHGSRPDAKHIVFCDGSGFDLFREDLELSHWRPNRTPRDYRADTSTEICFRFLDRPRPGPWTLAVNNHLDVDGMLSVYTLVHSPHAIQHRRTIIEAAEMGDFWGWGEASAQRLFQGLTLMMEEGRSQERDVAAIYADAFERVPAFIESTDPWSETIDASLAPLREGIVLVESGAIQRRVIDDRLSQYIIPSAVHRGEIARATYIPKFNEKISSNALLWPQARAKWDDQRVSLVSVEGDRGWQHDLWFPGYLWADIETRWMVPGMHYHDDMESYDLQLPAFTAAVAELNRLENGGASWTLGEPAFMFHSKIQSEFPVVLRVLDSEGRPTWSTIAPEEVTAMLKGVFE